MLGIVLVSYLLKNIKTMENKIDFKKIKEHIKKNRVATISSVSKLLNVNPITAERRLVSLELKGEIYRKEYNFPNSNRTFKQWGLEK